MKLGGRLSDPERLILKGACKSVSWKPAGFISLMVTLLVRSCEFSAQPINVAGEPETSNGSICLVAANCQPGVAVMPTELTYVDPLLKKGKLTPGSKGVSGLTDPLQRLV